MSDTVSRAAALVEGWLQQDVDAWTRKVLRRHFDPESGSPYWLRRARELDFDPRELERYADLAAFGPLTADQLRGLDPDELVPLAVPRPLTGWVWETGGTTGAPSRVVYTESMAAHRGAWRIHGLHAAGFEPGRVWLQGTPTGPHVIGNGFREAAGFAARVHGVDLDPRWVKRLLKAGRLAEAQEYTEHVLDQLTEVLRADRIDYLSTTPALFQQLSRREPELVAKLSGAWLSGTVITSKMYLAAREALSNGGVCGVAYGNTWGNAIAPTESIDDEVLPYLPGFPQLTTAVVDPRDWSAPVGYGEYGRVMLTVLHEDLFLPNVLERDRALRYDAAGRWPWDGVGNVGPLQNVQSGPEGIY